MNQYIANYIEKMASFSTVLSETVSLANEYWHPETPPVVMLFSQIGKTIVKIFMKWVILKEKIFKHVEDGMVSIDDELATVVATGLIEAIVTATDSNSLLWKDVSKFLGDKSKSHALVWKDFGQE
ncbi:hypothetical protein LB437_21495 [Escherichia coli]|uniref:hypothetical protein n=1 Tax=Escherichia coli TaxID=562 RepID=UPI004062D0F9